MAYNTHQAERIERIFKERSLDYRTMKMMGGWCVMLDEKMSVGIVKEQLMARVGPENYVQCLAKEGCNEMMFTGRSMKGYVFVSEDGIDKEEDLEFYVNLTIAHNPDAKRSKKKTKKKKTKK